MTIGVRVHRYHPKLPPNQWERHYRVYGAPELGPQQVIELLSTEYKINVGREIEEPHLGGRCVHQINIERQPSGIWQVHIQLSLRDPPESPPPPIDRETLPSEAGRTP